MNNQNNQNSIVNIIGQKQAGIPNENQISKCPYGNEDCPKCPKVDKGRQGEECTQEGCKGYPKNHTHPQEVKEWEDLLWLTVKSICDCDSKSPMECTSYFAIHSLVNSVRTSAIREEREKLKEMQEFTLATQLEYKNIIAKAIRERDEEYERKYEESHNAGFVEASKLAGEWIKNAVRERDAEIVAQLEKLPRYVYENKDKEKTHLVMDFYSCILEANLQDFINSLSNSRRG